MNDDYKVEHDAELEWKCIRSEKVIQDEWIDFRKECYAFPDGKTFEPFYNYTRRDYVVIVAKDVDDQYICVRQFRHGIKKVTTEFPAGGIEKGEDMLAAAKRELQEETGYVSDHWQHLISIPSAATVADHYAHVFLAERCEKITGQNLDETEFLNIRVYSDEYLRKLMDNESFLQAMHIMAYYMAKEKELFPKKEF